jgi:hypothetical protein
MQFMRTVPPYPVRECQLVAGRSALTGNTQRQKMEAEHDPLISGFRGMTSLLRAAR